MDRIVWLANKIIDNISDKSTGDICLRRAILKNGEYNVFPPRFPGRCLRYIHDIFTGLVDADWVYTLLVLGGSFSGGWLLFSLIWWLIAYAHDDLLEDHLPARQTETGWTPCILNIHGFASSFLYSLETQHTTGYGLRAITEECPQAIFILCCQCLFALIVDGFTVGVVVAKMIRPRMTNYTVQFSRNAVVAMRDGEVCLMFRVGDLKKYPLVGASVRAILIRNKKTKEGDILRSFHQDLAIEIDKAGSDPFLFWPITVVHKIDENSPFYTKSASDMLRSRFEIVLLIGGTVGSTGQGTNAQTSYLANEILWGQRFKSMITFDDASQSYMADYKNFEKTELVQMPKRSAADIKKGIYVSESKLSYLYQNIYETKDKDIDFYETSEESEDFPEYPILLKNKNAQKVLEDSATQTTPVFKRLRGTGIQQENGTSGLAKSLSNNINKVNSIPRTKLDKPSANNYDYINYTHLPSIPEKEDRSATPPFPNWV